MGEWINQTWYKGILFGNGSGEKGRLLIHTTIWVNLKVITLSKRSQTQKESILYDLRYIKL